MVKKLFLFEEKACFVANRGIKTKEPVTLLS